MPWASPDEPGPRSSQSFPDFDLTIHTHIHTHLVSLADLLPACPGWGAPDALKETLLLLSCCCAADAAHHLLFHLFLFSGSVIVPVNVSSIFHRVAYTSRDLIFGPVSFFFPSFFFLVVVLFFFSCYFFFLSTFLQAAWLLFLLLLLLLLLVTMLATMLHHHRHLCLPLSHKPCSDLPSPPCPTSSLRRVSHTLC